MNQRFALAFCLLLLAACSYEPAGPGADAAEPEAAQTLASHADVEPGLVLDPTFERAGTDQLLEHWQLYQHAGETSYRLDVLQGEVAIERTGPEPWGVLNQILVADTLVGKTLEWSVELSGELDDRYGAPFDVTGLLVSVTGLGPNDLPMMGNRHLLTLSSESGLPAGKLAPERHRLRFVVPEGRELELRVGVQLTRGGVLRVRAPSLQVIAEQGAT